MSHEDQPRAEDWDTTDALDLEAGRVFDAFLAALEAGRPADPAALLEEHPHLADRLRACLEVVHFAGGAVSASDSVASLARDLDALANGSSILSRVWQDEEGVPQVVLREPPGSLPPLLRPALLPVRGGLPALAGRYRLLGEIARGGIGAVFRGHDADLGRDLAIKVLLRKHEGDRDVLRRFIEEAQIGGQLQHPGIVPVYELGAFPDRRPYFAMKLVQGRTLAALLAERADPVQDRPRFLGIFEQVCQTVAYAHSRGVIHRDLKPSNVMVGSFGEVQVMDWGLAKVTTEGGIADDKRSQPDSPSAIRTVRSALSDDGSEAGSVLGTPAYMSPEQARGEVERLDERTDVFGLGAILGEVLTGAPPFVGASHADVRERAARGDLRDALDRLSSCGSEPEIVALAVNCLAAEPEARPRHAGEVATRMSAHLTGVQERLRSAELARAEAQARAESERERRRLVVGLAVAVVALVVLAGGGSAYMQRQRAARREALAYAVHERLDQAAALRGRAGAAAVGDLSGWTVALAEVKGAEDLLHLGEPDHALAASVAAARTELETARHAAVGRARDAAAERRLVERLEAVRANFGEYWDEERADREFADAFREFGLDVDALDPKQVGARLAGRPLSVEIAAALDFWCSLRRNTHLRDRADAPPWQGLAEAARTADPDPWRNALRAFYGQSAPNASTSLERLVTEAQGLHEQSATTLVLLAKMLEKAEARDESGRVLRDAWESYPGDFWVNVELGSSSWAGRRFSRPDEAVRHFTAAIAVRPRSYAAHTNLGIALLEMGKPLEAAREHRAALRLRPDSPALHNNLAEVLCELGNPSEAAQECRAALRLRPDYPEAHYNLGNAMRGLGKKTEAVEEYHAALRLSPGYAEAYGHLGLALCELGKTLDGVEAFREALRLRPNFFEAHNNLGNALRVLGKPSEAAEECRAALRLKPDSPEAHNNLGNALRTLGKPTEAVEEFRAALRLKPDYAEAHINLGGALYELGKLTEAVEALRAALRLSPDLAEAHVNLGNALHDLGKPLEAVEEYRVALRLSPDLTLAHYNLGIVLKSLGELDKAVQEYRRARDTAGPDPERRLPGIGRLLSETERLASLALRLPAVLRGEDRPKDAAEAITLAQLAHERNLYAGAFRLWCDAFEAEPKLLADMNAQNRFNAACAAALAAAGEGKDDPKLDDAARARLRRQALDWLKANRDAWAKLRETAPPQSRQQIAQTLQHWKADPDLAGVRDAEALARLPEEERKAWQALWADVDTLLAKVKEPADAS